LSVINIFGWHSHFGKSPRPSAIKAFVDPIKKYKKVNTIPLGQTSYHNFNYDSLIGQPIVFWGILPNLKLLENKKHNITWVPMYDNVVWNSKSWWNKLHKDLKIIAYSKKISDVSMQCGLETIRVQFFCNPKDFKKTDWNEGNKIFYWNRSGLLIKNDIEKICNQFNAKSIIFRNSLDFYSHDSQNISLEEKINNTKVTCIDSYIDHSKYMEFLSSCNIFIVPRMFEGIGLTFLEAMASGMFVISSDTPTMNEYISHKNNGVFLPFKIYRRNYNRLITKIEDIIRIKLSTISVLPKNYEFHNIAQLPFRTIGNQAREDHQKGYEIWEKSVPSIINFIFK